jgi:hypothetical protein
MSFFHLIKKQDTLQPTKNKLWFVLEVSVTHIDWQMAKSPIKVYIIKHQNGGF